MNIPAVYSAINAVTSELSKTGISKNNKNTQQGYKFRGIDDVLNALSSLLSEKKLSVLPRVLSRSVTERETRNGGALFYVVLDVEYDLVSSVDGSKHTIRVCGEAMDSGDKATNKALSAAYKYACIQTFCIPTEGDNDADATTHDVKHTKADPLGRDELNINGDHAKYANDLRLALEANATNAVKAISADLQEEGEEFYRAVWSLLDSKTRSEIKKILAAK